MVISQYAMNNISFVSEDPRDQHVFAYITRDEQTRKNYCHVFRGEDTVRISHCNIPYRINGCESDKIGLSVERLGLGSYRTLRSPVFKF